MNVVEFCVSVVETKTGGGLMLFVNLFVVHELHAIAKTFIFGA